MTNYSEVDAAILAAIREQQPTTFNPIWLAVRNVAGAVDNNHEAWRIVDRRLHALKQAGRVEFLTMKKIKAAGTGESRGGWKIKES